MKRLIYSAIFLCVAILVANANEAVDSIAVKSHVNVIIGSKENEQDVENAFKENIPQDKIQNTKNLYKLRSLPFCS